MKTHHLFIAILLLVSAQCAYFASIPVKRQQEASDVEAPAFKRSADSQPPDHIMSGNVSSLALADSDSSADAVAESKNVGANSGRIVEANSGGFSSTMVLVMISVWNLIKT